MSINAVSVLTSVVGIGVGENKEVELKGLEVGKMLLVTRGVVVAAVLCDILCVVLCDVLLEDVVGSPESLP
jgi:hypothetical protein